MGEKAKLGRLGLALTLGLLATSLGAQSFLSLSAELSATDNVTNAVFEEDRYSESHWISGLEAGLGFRPNRNQSLTFAASFAAALAQQRSDLGHMDAGIEARWVAKTRLGADAPRFVVAASSRYRDFGSAIRSGWTTMATLGYSRPIGARWDFGVETGATDRDASTRAFDQQAVFAQLDVGLKLSRRASLSLAVRYRDGDVTSTSTPGTIDPRVKPIKELADVIEQDDVFRDKVAYRLQASSWRGAIGWSLDVASSGSLHIELSSELTQAATGIDYDVQAAAAIWRYTL